MHSSEPCKFIMHYIFNLVMDFFQSRKIQITWNIYTIVPMCADTHL